MRTLLLSMLAASVWAQPSAKPAVPAKPAAPKAPAAKSAPAAQPNPSARPAAAAKAASMTGEVKPGTAPSAAVLTIDGESMTVAEFESLVGALPPNVRQDVMAEGGKRRLAERLLEIRALAGEARRRGIAQRPAVVQQMRLNQDNLLASLLFQELVSQAKPTDEQVSSYYQEHKDEYEQASARHILVRFAGSRVPLKEGQKDLTEQESLELARKIRDRIVKGEDFAEAAKKDSDDTGSGAMGGDLGTFGRGQMVKEFADSVFTLPIGEVSEPVRTQFGYHLIQVQKRETKPLEEVKAAIEQKLAPEGAQKAAEAIRTSAKTSLDENYFGPPPPAEK